MGVLRIVVRWAFAHRGMMGGFAHREAMGGFAHRSAMGGFAHRKAMGILRSFALP